MVSGTGSAAADAGAPIPPSQDPRALTAGVWDDNLNYTRVHEFRSSVQQSRTSGVLPFGNEEFEAAHQKFSASRSARQQLDVALMIDTTGSMGDEIAYLQREFSDLSRSIESAYPNAAQRWALVVYRDQGDEYVANAFNFVEDKETFREKLAKQSAGGGGDTPEAPEAAFAALNQLEWRTAPDVARLVFWVADAPHHDGAAAALADGVRKTRDLDVHVYPVASSGVDELTELSMRSAAQLTGGRYLFLTDDSGIGGAHKEPTIPCYFVTTLKNAITRVVDIELSGTYREPLAAQIIRTGGDPKNGACKLADETLQVF
ncbi:MAG TPA: vWA domain-containing protein [Polyangiales bacterium]